MKTPIDFKRIDRDTRNFYRFMAKSTYIFVMSFPAAYQMTKQYWEEMKEENRDGNSGEE